MTERDETYTFKSLNRYRRHKQYRVASGAGYGTVDNQGTLDVGMNEPPYDLEDEFFRPSPTITQRWLDDIASIRSPALQREVEVRYDEEFMERASRIMSPDEMRELLGNG